MKVGADYSKMMEVRNEAMKVAMQKEREAHKQRVEEHKKKAKSKSIFVVPKADYYVKH